MSPIVPKCEVHDVRYLGRYRGKADVAHKPQDELAALWAQYGDHENMVWESRYCLPVAREEPGEKRAACLRQENARTRGRER